MKTITNDVLTANAAMKTSIAKTKGKGNLPQVDCRVLSMVNEVAKAAGLPKKGISLAAFMGRIVATGLASFMNAKEITLEDGDFALRLNAKMSELDSLIVPLEKANEVEAEDF